MLRAPSAEDEPVRLQSRAIIYFDMIRRAGSIREAARRLNVAASAVHRQLLNLEADVGVPLFERLPEGLRLTAGGEALARHVQLVMKDARRIENEIAAIRGARAGEIVVATVESAEFELIPEAIEQLHAHYPAVRVVVQTAPATQIAGMLTGGAADIGIGFHVPWHPGIRRIASHRLSFGAIMRPDNPLAAHEILTPGMCAAAPLILPKGALVGGEAHPGSLQAVIEPLLRSHRDTLEVITQVSSFTLMRRMVMRTGALAFHTNIGLGAEIAEGKLVFRPIALPEEIVTEFGIYTRAERNIHPSQEVLVEILRVSLDRSLGGGGDAVLK